MVLNPLIFYKVLKSLGNYRQVQGKTMYRKIMLMGVLFETCCIIRTVLIFKQEDWKQNNPINFNIAFSVYILVGEVSCQLVLISGILVYTHKLRVRYLRRGPFLEHSLDEDEGLNGSKGNNSTTDISTGRNAFPLFNTDENRRLTKQQQRSDHMKRTVISTEDSPKELLGEDDDRTENFMSVLMKHQTNKDDSVATPYS